MQRSSSFDPCSRPSSGPRDPASQRRRPIRSYQRGVTLVELLVVVVLIAIFASIAAPAILRSTQDRRAYEGATGLAQLMQEARGRALATGSAHLVAMNANGTTVRGHFLLYQAYYNSEPTAGCLTAGQWTTDAKTVNDTPAALGAGAGVVNVDGVNLTYSANSDLQATFAQGGNANASLFTFLCFSPGGRVYYFPDQASLIASNGTPLNGAFEVRITRNPNGTQEGLTRSVFIDGTDTARVKSY